MFADSLITTKNITAGAIFTIFFWISGQIMKIIIGINCTIIFTSDEGDICRQEEEEKLNLTSRILLNAIIYHECDKVA